MQAVGVVDDVKFCHVDVLVVCEEPDVLGYEAEWGVRFVVGVGVGVVSGVTAVCCSCGDNGLREDGLVVVDSRELER